MEVFLYGVRLGRIPLSSELLAPLGQGKLIFAEIVRSVVEDGGDGSSEYKEHRFRENMRRGTSFSRRLAVCGFKLR